MPLICSIYSWRRNSYFEITFQLSSVKYTEEPPIATSIATTPSHFPDTSSTAAISPQTGKFYTHVDWTYQFKISAFVWVMGIWYRGYQSHALDCENGMSIMKMECRIGNVLVYSSFFWYLLLRIESSVSIESNIQKHFNLRSQHMTLSTDWKMAGNDWKRLMTYWT